MLATSLFEGWLNRVAGSGLSRLAKAALWQMRAGGLRSALTLVFDLHASGFDPAMTWARLSLCS
ncbi:hypothetical protein [Streptomyces sp. NPDC057686]|uniref:hypothetical protein n=1 Tax=Streptomyces sp. NPDC057686 TaxID=3346212 RepID=UPI00367F72C6